MQINQKEIDSVIKLEPIKRYHHFLKRVADNETMFLLCKNRNDFALTSIDNYTLFSIWPFEEYANLCKVDEWIEYKTIKISIEDFEEIIKPLIIQNNYLINIFPINNSTGFVVDLNEFIQDLNEELEQYE
ncbi:MAG: DUF2750 domain-containing protein [Bacteroidota bacterium]